MLLHLKQYCYKTNIVTVQGLEVMVRVAGRRVHGVSPPPNSTPLPGRPSLQKRLIRFRVENDCYGSGLKNIVTVQDSKQVVTIEKRLLKHDCYRSGIRG